MATKKIPIQKKNTRPAPKKLEKLKKKYDTAARHATATLSLGAFDEGKIVVEDVNSKPATQKDVLKQTPLVVEKQVLDLELSSGPYKLAFTPNGRYLALGGHKGGLSVLDCHTLDISCDFNAKEKIRDICFYHNESMFAAAQKKYTYIYDTQGTEIHVLRDMKYTYCVDFLPFHFLLVRIGERGELRYLDVSTGDIASSIYTKKGPCDVMKPNPSNAVICCGHERGHVTMWTPNQKEAALTFKPQKAKITALAVSPDGQHLATSGLEGSVQIWDQRNLNSSLFSHAIPAATGVELSFSQRSLLSIACENTVAVWDMDKAMPLLTETIPNSCDGISSVGFRPFEDLLYVGHGAGLKSLVVPGSAVANYDSLATNPFETTKEKREKEIRALLEKIPPSAIRCQIEV